MILNKTDVTLIFLHTDFLTQQCTKLLFQNCLSRWDEFEDSYQQFNTWLREVEVQLRAETEHDSTVEEKKRHWDEHQVQNFNLLFL